MTAEKSKRKNRAGIDSSNLLIRCRARGKTITGLAREINRSRQAIYYAVENPRRLSITFDLVQKALA
jgi:hypothetical protein